jgi:hypothetical protein
MRLRRCPPSVPGVGEVYGPEAERRVYVRPGMVRRLENNHADDKGSRR